MIKSFYITIFLTLSTLSYADTISDLKQFLQQTKELKAKFVQTVSTSSGDAIENSQGVLYLQRPNKFRWEYKQPYKLTIVADGERLWVYDYDLEQVTVQEQKKSLADTPALLLSDTEELIKKFSIQHTSDQDKLGVSGVEWLELKPNIGEGSFESIHVAIQNKQLKQLKVVDSLAQVTVIKLQEISTLDDIPSKLFRFIPPDGVDIIF